MGNIELAMDGLPRGSPARESLTAATQAARRAAEVSTQMLAYLGQSSGEKNPLDLAEVCRQNIPLLLSTTPVVLETDFAVPGPVIIANANQLQQVLLNLVTNAWEAVGPNRGAIRVSVKTVSAAEVTNSARYPVDWQPQSGAYACLEVADGGCGIAAADFDKIFDPFFSRKFAGRGLGLAVVLGIARAHNAGITVESEPGMGSTFRVYFPLVEHAVAPAASSAGAAPAFKAGGMVLVVDDTETVRDLAAHVIRSLGFKVLTAQDGVEALAVYRQHQAEIRCVLCDLTMPHMNGWETIAALRKLTPGIPVILASGYDEVGVQASKYTEQPQAFLGKPYDRGKLQTTLSHVLASSPG
jgi:CheY-like chemotaxis protein